MDHVPTGEPAKRFGPEPVFGFAVLAAVLAHLLTGLVLVGHWVLIAPSASGPPPVGEGIDADAIGVLLVDDPDPTTRNMSPPDMAKPESKAQPENAPTQQAAATPPPLKGLVLPEDTGPAQQQSETPTPENPSPDADQAQPATAAAEESPAKPDSTTATARAGKIDHFVRTVIEALGKSKPKPQPIQATVVVEFVVSLLGELEGVRVLTSSGIPVVDELAIEAVRHARFLAPPSDASRIDRTFHIAYHFG